MSGFSSGKYFPDVNQGNVFIGSTAIAGVVPPAYNATAHTFVVWNPLGSGKNIVPLRLSMGYVDTTEAAGNVVISYQTGVGSQVATGAAITAMTLGTPINAKVGGGGSSVAKFAPATATFAAATSLLMSTGISQFAGAAATSTAPQWRSTYDFDGQIIVLPGVAICVAGNISLLAKFDISMMWAEIDED